MFEVHVVASPGREAPIVIGAFADRPSAERVGHACGLPVVTMIDKAAVERKFDAYVPADQASDLRWRIAELEAQRVELLQRLAIADEAILAAAELFSAYPGSRLAVRGPADVVAFARKVLELAQRVAL